MPDPLRPRDPRSLGPYALLGRLGEGGMGVVYLGRDPAGRSVAVKILRDELSYDDEFRRRFRSEVNRAREVPPFCTAEVLEADPDHNPPYLVIEYVDGPSLADVVERRGPLRDAELHSVAVGIATALTAIHGARVIHRDLKPQNVLFALGGVKVIDFGIARPAEVTSRHTRTGQMVGTVAYMAPERFDGSGDTADPAAADIFAWGAVVAYAATGRTPFAGDSPQATALRILTQPPDLTGVPDRLRPVVAVALEKDPRRRPTARRLLDMLLAEERPAATGPVPPTEPAAPPVPLVDRGRWTDKSRRDRAGFRAFVSEQVTPLRDLAYIVCGDWETAERVVVDVLATAYPRWHRLRRPDLRIKAMVVRSAGKKSRPAGPGRHPGSPERQLVTAAMRLILPQQRAALMMRYAMRMPPDDIAEVLGWHRYHLEAQIGNGLAQLHGHLGEAGRMRAEPSRRRA